MTAGSPSLSPSCATDRAPLAHAIAALGEGDFPRRFGQLLACIVPADLFSAFRVDARGRLDFLFAGGGLDGDDGAFARAASTRYAESYWKEDPVMRDVLTDPAGDRAIFPQPWDAIPRSEYRTFCYERARVEERVLIRCRPAGATVLVGLYRTRARGRFSDAHLNRIEQEAEVLAAVAAKHADLSRDLDGPRLRPEAAAVARRMAATHPRLSPREAAVCANLLLGRSAKEAALEIGVRPSSVITFRKRAFVKLDISTQRELVRLYEDALS